MPSHFAVRITKSFSDLSGVVRAWALKADKMIVYEHVGDETEKVHIHLLMLGVSVDAERLKQIAQATNRNLGSGNGFWSFKTKVKKDTISPNNSDKFITYMSKGKLEPSYNQGWDEATLARLKDAWVDQVNLSREQKLYWEFVDYLKVTVDDPEVRFHYDEKLYNTDENVSILKSLSRSWAFQYHTQIWSVRTATDAKMVFLTYCMRNNMTIPQDVKYW